MCLHNGHSIKSGNMYNVFMKKIVNADSHRIALRLAGWSEYKTRRCPVASSGLSDSASAVLAGLAEELAGQMCESDDGSPLFVMDKNDSDAKQISSGQKSSDSSYFTIVVEEKRHRAKNLKILADADIKSYSIQEPLSFHELALKLDPWLARQEISLKNFSLSVQQYWIRLQNSYPDTTVDSFCAELLIQRSYFYKLLRAERHPSRNLAIALCLGLKLDIKEAQDLLMNLGEQLNHQVKRDYILMFGFEKSLTIDQVEELLIRFESRTLLGRF